MNRPEFSRRVPLQRIGAHGLEQDVQANAAELQALAARLQIPAVTSLRCRFTLGAPSHGAVEAEGELRAEVTQVCVVTLEPFEAVVQERFRLHFVPEGAENDDPDPDAPDEVPYRDDAIDLGETATEQLALGLDPYPRRPGLPADALPGLLGIEGDDEVVDPIEESALPDRPHPFAILAARAKGGGGGGNA